MPQKRHNFRCHIIRKWCNMWVVREQRSCSECIVGRSATYEGARRIALRLEREGK